MSLPPKFVVQILTTAFWRTEFIGIKMSGLFFGEHEYFYIKSKIKYENVDIAATIWEENVIFHHLPIPINLMTFKPKL